MITEREYKQIFFKTKHSNKYRVIFGIEGSVVTVLRIRGQGQQLLATDDLPNG